MGFESEESNGGSTGLSGTLNYIVKFTSATTGGNSQLFDDGTNVGINIFASLGAKLHVKGDGATKATYAFKAVDSASASLFSIYNSGHVYSAVQVENMFIGDNAGILNDPASIANTGLGFHVLANNVGGQLNTGTGARALEENITGNNNSAYGVECLQFNTAGHNNTAMGYQALHLNTGDGNNAFGVDACYSNTSGANNIGVGGQALYSNQTGLDNVAVGFNALAGTTASYNVGIGAYAMYSNGAGQQNVSSGLQCMYTNSTGSYNSAYGTNALYLNSTGNYNVAIGYEAGHYETGSNHLWIDNATRASLADGKVKALIYGVFDAAVANQVLAFNAQVISVAFLPTGNVGVASGSLYVDTPANIATNMDLTVARKV